MDYRYAINGNIFEVRVSGRFFLSEALENFDLILRYCVTTRLSRVLIDYREMSEMPESTLLYLYEFGIEERYRRHMIQTNSSIHFATVSIGITSTVMQETFTRTDDSFSIQTKTFTNLEAARNWLS